MALAAKCSTVREGWCASELIMLYRLEGESGGYRNESRVQYRVSVPSSSTAKCHYVRHHLTSTPPPPTSVTLPLCRTPLPPHQSPFAVYSAPSQTCMCASVALTLRRRQTLYGVSRMFNQQPQIPPPGPLRGFQHGVKTTSNAKNVCALRIPLPHTSQRFALGAGDVFLVGVNPTCSIPAL